MTNLTFGQAIDALKRGDKVARIGWNGKGMFLYLLRALRGTLLVGPDKTDPTTFIYKEVDLQPCIVMHTAQQTHQPGWLASQADILADDWCVV